MNKIIVIDLEVNKEFELVRFDFDEGKVVIRSDEYGFCSQVISKIKFTNNQINFVEKLTPDNDILFSEWLGKNDYHFIDIYSKYLMEEGTREIYPDYDTFVETRWTTHDDIPEIMYDNNNEELEWVLANSYATEEIYKIFKNNNL